MGRAMQSERIAETSSFGTLNGVSGAAQDHLAQQKAAGTPSGFRN
jgi:hypothetical protein